MNRDVNAQGRDKADVINFILQDNNSRSKDTKIKDSYLSYRYGSDTIAPDISIRIDKNGYNARNNNPIKFNVTVEDSQNAGLRVRKTRSEETINRKTLGSRQGRDGFVPRIDSSKFELIVDGTTVLNATSSEVKDLLKNDYTKYRADAQDNNLAEGIKLDKSGNSYKKSFQLTWDGKADGSGE